MAGIQAIAILLMSLRCLLTHSSQLLTQAISKCVRLAANSASPVVRSARCVDSRMESKASACERKMLTMTLKRSCLIILLVLSVTQVLAAQQKPRVFFSDDFFLESSPPMYLWFYDQKGILDKVHAVDGTAVELVKAFAKN